MKSNVYIPNVGFRQAGVRLEAMELTLRRDGAGARALARALPPLAARLNALRQNEPLQTLARHRLDLPPDMPKRFEARAVAPASLPGGDRRPMLHRRMSSTDEFDETSLES